MQLRNEATNDQRDQDTVNQPMQIRKKKNRYGRTVTKQQDGRAGAQKSMQLPSYT